MKQYIRKLKDFFRYRESLACFVLLNEQQEVVDYRYVQGSSAHKSNEVDYAFGEFIRYHLKHTHSDIYTPPFQMLRYDLSDRNILPVGEIESTVYVQKVLLPFIKREQLRPVKAFDLRQLYFTLHFDLYSLDALSGSVGIEKAVGDRPNGKRYIVNRILPADLENHRSYAFYCEMIALQDENHKQK